MKRIIPLILALLLSLIPAALGEENRLFTLGDYEYLRTLLAGEDALYFAGEEKLYTWREGEAEPTAWTSDIRLPGAEEDAAAGMYELNLFTREGGLSAVTIARDEDYRPTGLRLFDVAFTDGGTLEAENIRELALPDELEGLDYFSLSGVCAGEGGLYLLVDVDNGMALCVLDPESPGSAKFQPLDDWGVSLLPAGDGVLLSKNDYMNDRILLCRVLPDGGLEELCGLPQDAAAVAADPVTGAVYAVASGMACPVDPATGELGEPFAALPVQPGGGAALGGIYAVVLNENRVAVLDTTKQLQRDAVLTISAGYNSDWLRNAVIDYSVAHPELPATMSYSDGSALDAMMTRSAGTDIYIMNTAYDNDYRALLARGYMLPLDSSEALAALAERMYPGLLAGVGSDGRLAALPLDLSASALGVDVELLEAMGFSEDDLPGDWPGFLDLLDEIALRMDRLPEGGHFTYDDMSAKGFRFYLVNAVLDQFARSAQAAGKIPDYESPHLVEVLERLDAMDFTAFGLSDEDDDMGYGYSWGGDVRYLIQLDASYVFENADVIGTPLPLGFGEDLPGAVAVNLFAAFVNPFSAHPDAAVAFLESLAEQLPETTRYALFPDLNEPLPDPDANRLLGEYEEYVAACQAELDAAGPSDRQMLEEELQRAESTLEYYRQRGLWLIPRERLDWYRANGDKLTVAFPSWFQRDESGEAWELLEQYRSGLLSARDFLSAVNQKSRMMAMEEG